jgi:hypothetical protein
MTTSNTSSVVPVPDVDEVERDFHYKYTVQKGYFLQSEDSTDDQSFDFVRSRLTLSHILSLSFSLMPILV